MIQINMLAPKPDGKWCRIEKWRGRYVIVFRPKGQFYHTMLSVELWDTRPCDNSFYTLKKVKRVTHYQKN